MSTPARTRLLFVDDQPIILELLQLSLAAMKDEWEAIGATSAEEALALLEKTAVDVVVSDMGLPGMTGAQLLNEVMQRYPATIRIILSGFADQAQEMKRRVVEVEREAYRATHAEVGGYLLDLWGLPAPLVEAVAWHHEPSKAPEPAFGALTAVHVANALEYEFTAAPSQQELDIAYLAGLNLEARLDVWRAALRQCNPR